LKKCPVSQSEPGISLSSHSAIAQLDEKIKTIVKDMKLGRVYVNVQICKCGDGIQVAVISNYSTSGKRPLDYFHISTSAGRRHIFTLKKCPVSKSEPGISLSSHSAIAQLDEKIKTIVKDMKLGRVYVNVQICKCGDGIQVAVISNYSTSGKRSLDYFHISTSAGGGTFSH